MNDPLSRIADAMEAAHDAAAEIVEYARDHGGLRSGWHIGRTKDPPEVLLSDDRFDSKDTLTVKELPDARTARYTFRELLDRGFSGEDEQDNEGRYIYAYRVS